MGRLTGYSLLTANTKLKKTLDGQKWLVAGLSMAPHTYGFESNEGPSKLRNVCANATPGCIKSCVLHFSGRTVMQSVRDAAARRKQMFQDHNDQFMAYLRADLFRVRNQAADKKMRPFVRLNVGSDVNWTVDHPELFEEFSDITFYDYSKNPDAVRLENYHLTFSRSERNENDVLAKLAAGWNVAVVFDSLWNPQHNKIGALPANWNGYTVVDGDVHDVRIPEFDGNNVVVGLRLKGKKDSKAEAIKTGFAVSGWEAAAGDNLIHHPKAA